MIVTNRFDPDVRVYKEAKYLVSKGFDVEILCWDREGEYKNRATEEIEGIKIKRFFPYSKYGTGYKQIVSYIRFIKKCKQYLKDKEYNYLHCHDLDGVIVGFICKSRYSKIIFDMHEFYEGKCTNKIISYLIKFLVNNIQDRSDSIIYLNQLQKEAMRPRNIKKLIFLPNYPEYDNYRYCEKSKSSNLRIAYIGAVRQYTELKNLMDACNGIDNVSISIHGGGTAYKGLYNIKNNYKNIEITGVYHFSESTKLYSQTDILYALYPMNTIQNKMGYPVKFFEAIITKTPVIVSKGSILEEFLKENDIGFAVDGSNVEEIRKLIIDIINDRSLLDKKLKELDKIQYNYTWDKVVKNLDKIYPINS